MVEPVVVMMRPGYALFRRVLWIGVMMVLLAGVGVQRRCGGHAARSRVATFNIRMYPASPQQVEGAFRLIRSLGVAAVAVQEILDPAHLEESARVHLGPTWRFVHPAVGPEQRVGVLVDESVFSVEFVRSHLETVLYPGGKPALEVCLRQRSDGEILRMIVVHLRAGADGIALRARQMQALTGPVARAVRSGEPVLLLGDFNTTSPGDREQLQQLAGRTGLAWSSRGLRCTSYWRRDDGCPGTPLDHVLASDSGATVTARGPCESIGCAPGASCPIFHDEVSDHCPVTVEWR